MRLYGFSQAARPDWTSWEVNEDGTLGAEATFHRATLPAAGSILDRHTDFGSTPTQANASALGGACWLVDDRILAVGAGGISVLQIHKERPWKTLHPEHDIDGSLSFIGGAVVGGSPTHHIGWLLLSNGTLRRFGYDLLSGTVNLTLDETIGTGSLPTWIALTSPATLAVGRGGTYLLYPVETDGGLGVPATHPLGINVVDRLAVTSAGLAVARLVDESGGVQGPLHGALRYLTVGADGTVRRVGDEPPDPSAPTSLPLLSTDGPPFEGVIQPRAEPRLVAMEFAANCQRRSYAVEGGLPSASGGLTDRLTLESGPRASTQGAMLAAPGKFLTLGSRGFRPYHLPRGQQNFEAYPSVGSPPLRDAVWIDGAGVRRNRWRGGFMVRGPRGYLLEIQARVLVPVLWNNETNSWFEQENGSVEDPDRSLVTLEHLGEAAWQDAFMLDESVAVAVDSFNHVLHFFEAFEGGWIRPMVSGGSLVSQAYRTDINVLGGAASAPGAFSLAASDPGPDRLFLFRDSRASDTLVPAISPADPPLLPAANDPRAVAMTQDPLGVLDAPVVVPGRTQDLRAVPGMAAQSVLLSFRPPRLGVPTSYQWRARAPGGGLSDWQALPLAALTEKSGTDILTVEVPRAGDTATLDDGVVYAFQVRALHGSGMSLPTDAHPGAWPALPEAGQVDQPGDEGVTFLQAPNFIPPPPSNVRTTASSSAILIEWAAGDARITAYQIRWALTSAFPGDPDEGWKDISLSSAQTVAHTIPDPLDETDPELQLHNFYTIQLRAVVRFQEGGEEREVVGEPSVRVETVVGVTPSAPTGLEIQPTADGGILTWLDPLNNEIDHYEHRVSVMENGGEWERITASGPETTAFVIQGLEQNTAYYVQIRAHAGAQVSEPSSAVSWTTLNPPAQMDGLAASSGVEYVLWAFRRLNDDARDGSVVYQYQIDTDEDSNGSWINASPSEVERNYISLVGLLPNDLHVHMRAVRHNSFGPATPNLPALPVVSGAEFFGGEIAMSEDSVTLSVAKDAADVGSPTAVSFGAKGIVGPTTAFDESVPLPAHLEAPFEQVLEGSLPTPPFVFEFRVTYERTDDEEVKETLPDLTYTYSTDILQIVPRQVSHTYTNDSLTLHWVPLDTTESRYQLKFAKEADYAGAVWVDLPAASNLSGRHLIPSLEEHAVYQYQLRAVKSFQSNGESFRITAQATEPETQELSFEAGAPFFINVHDRMTDGFRLTWAITPFGSSITGYQFRIAEDTPETRQRLQTNPEEEDGLPETAWNALDNANAGTVGHTLDGLADGTVYLYQVRALSGTMTGAPSDIVEVATVPETPDFSIIGSLQYVSITWPLQEGATYQYRIDSSPWIGMVEQVLGSRTRYIDGVSRGDHIVEARMILNGVPSDAHQETKTVTSVSDYNGVAEEWINGHSLMRLQPGPAEAIQGDGTVRVFNITAGPRQGGEDIGFESAQGEVFLLGPSQYDPDDILVGSSQSGFDHYYRNGEFAAIVYGGLGFRRAPNEDALLFLPDLTSFASFSGPRSGNGPRGGGYKRTGHISPITLLDQLPPT